MRFQYDIFENFKSFYVYTRTLDETKKVANVIDNLAEDYEYSWGEVPEFNEERFDEGGSAFRIWGDDITTQRDAKHIYREIKAMAKTETAETTETAKTAETAETTETSEPVTSEPFFYSRITEPTEIFRLCDTDGDAITLALPYGLAIVWQNKYLAGVWVEHMDVNEKNIVVCLQMLAKKYGVVTFPETLTTEIGKILVSLPFGNVRRLRSNTGVTI